MDGLELLSVEKGSVLTSGSFVSTTDTEAETMTFHWFAQENVAGDGEIARLKFKISENARGDYPLTVRSSPKYKYFTVTDIRRYFLNFNQFL